MNKLSILFVGLTISMVSAFLDEVNSYHTMVGIPLANRIKEAEAKMMAASHSTLISRIVGGSPAPEHAYPYLAAQLIDLVGTTNISMCGSSILTSNRLVTAAHCWMDMHKQAYQFRVVLGSNHLYIDDGVRIITRDVKVHPEWNPRNVNNDIAMIYLPNDIVFNDIIHPIDLPSGSYLTSDFAGEQVIAAGFGTTGEDREASSFLSHIVLRVITNEECRRWFKHEIVPPSKLCTDGAGGVGTCFGDSGGPLVCHVNGQPMLIGITSFVYEKGCALGFPSAFTRVTDYYGYIQQHL